MHLIVSDRVNPDRKLLKNCAQRCLCSLARKWLKAGHISWLGLDWLVNLRLGPVLADTRTHPAQQDDQHGCAQPHHHDDQNQGRKQVHRRRAQSHQHSPELGRRKG